MELSKVLPEGRSHVPLDLVRMGDNTTYVLPRGFMTAASTTSEAACAGVRKACQVGIRSAESEWHLDICRGSMTGSSTTSEAACARVRIRPARWVSGTRYQMLCPWPAPMPCGRQQACGYKVQQL